MIVDSEICGDENGEQMRLVVRLPHRLGRMKERADQRWVLSVVEVQFLISLYLAAVGALGEEHRLVSFRSRLLLESKKTPRLMS